MEAGTSYDPRQWFSLSKLYDSKTQAAAVSAVGQQQQQQQYASTNEQLQLNKKLVQDEYGVYEADDSSTHAHIDNRTPSNNTDTFNPQPLQPTDDEVDGKNLAEMRDPIKLDCYITSLQKLVSVLPPEHKKQFPYDLICQLAHAVLDGTVFEITKGLQDIQKITEENLATRRSNLVNDHRLQRNEILKRQQEEASLIQGKPHRRVVVEKQHTEERLLFQQHCDKELTSLDQKLVLELDRQASDQQATLQRAGLPFFFITNEPDDIKLQIYVLSFIIKLSGA